VKDVYTQHTVDTRGERRGRVCQDRVFAQRRTKHTDTLDRENRNAQCSLKRANKNFSSGSRSDSLKKIGMDNSIHRARVDDQFSPGLLPTVHAKRLGSLGVQREAGGGYTFSNDDRHFWVNFPTPFHSHVLGRRLDHEV
jgi:hypothetical protein